MPETVAFEVAVSDKLKVYEGQTAFWLENLETGDVACIGDGVDMFHNANDEQIMVGTKEFYDCLEHYVRNEADLLLKIFFGENNND